MKAEDLDVLARTVYGEARGEGLDGQVAVAWVIVNRTTHGQRFGGPAIVGVCLRPYQFSCWNADDPNLDVIRSASVEQPAFMQCFGVACLVLAGALPDPTMGATHYFADSIKAPKWVAGMEPRAKIGAHNFFLEGGLRA